MHLRVAFFDGGMRSAVETEPREDQIVVAPGGRSDDFLDHFGRDGAVLRTEHHADRGLALRVGIAFADIHPTPFGMDAGGTAGGVDRVEARELLLLVIREADAVHAEQIHHLAQVRFEVLPPRPVAPTPSPWPGGGIHLGRSTPESGHRPRCLGPRRPAGGSATEAPPPSPSAT